MSLLDRNGKAVQIGDRILSSHTSDVLPSGLIEFVVDGLPGVDKPYPIIARIDDRRRSLAYAKGLRVWLDGKEFQIIGRTHE